MLKSCKKVILPGFICIFALFSLTGCERPENHIVKTSTLDKMIHSDYGIPNTGHDEMVRLNNGVVIYKDHTNAPSPSGYSAVNPSVAGQVKFGPSELNFAPKNVNPK